MGLAAGSPRDEAERLIQLSVHAWFVGFAVTLCAGRWDLDSLFICPKLVGGPGSLDRVDPGPLVLSSPCPRCPVLWSAAAWFYVPRPGLVALVVTFLLRHLLTTTNTNGQNKSNSKNRQSGATATRTASEEIL